MAPRFVDDGVGAIDHRLRQFPSVAEPVGGESVDLQRHRHPVLDRNRRRVLSVEHVGREMALGGSNREVVGPQVKEGALCGVPGQRGEDRHTRPFGGGQHRIDGDDDGHVRADPDRVHAARQDR